MLNYNWTIIFKLYLEFKMFLRIPYLTRLKEIKEEQLVLEKIQLEYLCDIESHLNIIVKRRLKKNDKRN